MLFTNNFDLILEHPQNKHFKYDGTTSNIEANVKDLPGDISVVNARAMLFKRPHLRSHSGKIYSHHSTLKYHVYLVHSDPRNIYFFPSII